MHPKDKEYEIKQAQVANAIALGLVQAIDKSVVADLTYGALLDAASYVMREIERQST